MPDEELVTLTIDDIEVKVPKGTLLVEAAKQIHTEIPVFCYHAKLRSVGACRMCLVEVEKMRGLQTACTTVVVDGMVARTKTAEVGGAQNGVLEFLLANHPLDCPICDKGGECPLQDNTFKFARGTSRFQEEKRHLSKAIPLSDRIALDRERCIMCYRCVRFQDEIVGDAKLSAISRAGSTYIGVLEGETFDSPFSGNTIELCPVGALTSRQYRFRSRPWDLQRTPSICVGCGVGCNIELDSRENQVKRMVARENMDVNNEWLCDRGRFETLPVGIERLREPSVDGKPVSWEQAIKAAASRLGQGPVEIIVSPSITNEALNAVKAIAQYLKAPASVWPQQTGRVAGGMSQLLASETIVLTDFDVWSELPVLALRIREALKHGASLYFIGSKSNGLARDTRAAFNTVDEFLAAKLELAGPVSVLGTGAEALAKQLKAEGMVGLPSLAANGYAMSDLSAAEFSAPTLLLVGDETWPGTIGKSVVSLRWSMAGIAPSKSEVLLPLTHPYEQTGTLTNFEGRVQTLKAGARAREHERADWLALSDLAAAVGASPLTAVGPRDAKLA